MSDRKKLEKLVIKSFKEKDFNKEDSSRKFTVPINPESFTQSLKVDIDTTQGVGTPSAEAKYKKTEPEQLTLEFILDGTQTMEGYGGKTDLKNKPASEQLNELKNCVYYLDGTIHRPSFLIVSWGSDLNFKCIISSLDLSYTLFEPDGAPLRIKVKANFISYASSQEMLAKARISSPDLTHYRKVEGGNRLDLLTYSIYNDSKYFMQVAMVNGLTSIRQVQPGIELYFPPLNKNEA